MTIQLVNNKKKPQIFLFNKNDLRERLDVEYYQPYHYQDLKLLQESKFTCSKLDDICTKIVDGPFGSAIKADDYVDIGIPFIRVADVTKGEGSINIDKMIFISEDAHKKIIRSKINPGDVVIAKTGATMGAASVVPERILEANIRGDLAALSVKKDICLPRYLITFINTKIGQRLFWRLNSGGTRGRVVIGNLKKYPILIPSLEEQYKIVAKIDKAYIIKQQKEQEAQELLDSIDDYLLRELGIKRFETQEKNTIQSRIFYRQASEVLSYRFDPNTYQEERLNAIRCIENGIYSTMPLHKIANHKSNKVRNIYQKNTYVGLENIESNTGEFIFTESKESISSATIFGMDDILFPKLRPYLNKVYHSNIEGICSTEFHVFNSSSEHNEYLAHFLRSKIVVDQTKYLMSGNTLPRLQFDVSS